MGTVLCAAAGLASCANPPPPPPPTTLEMTLTAAPDVNPDRDGRPSPIQIDVYQLANISAFNNADYFALTDNPTGTLGPALLGHERFALTPGQFRTYFRQLPAKAHFVGVVAGYRDIDNAIWRASEVVTPHQTTRPEMVVGKSALALKWQPPTGQQPAAQRPMLQGPTIQGPTLQPPTLQAPTLQTPTVQGPTLQGPTLQAPAWQEPK